MPFTQLCGTPHSIVALVNFNSCLYLGKPCSLTSKRAMLLLLLLLLLLIMLLIRLLVTFSTAVCLSDSIQCQLE